MRGQNVAAADTPFIAHPVRVAITVMAAFGCADEEVVAASLLHDALEKTSLRSAQIGEALGPRVLDLVMAMTKRSTFDESIYWQRLRRDVWEARLIKMADVLDHLDCPPQELPHRIDNAEKRWRSPIPKRNRSCGRGDSRGLAAERQRSL